MDSTEAGPLTACEFVPANEPWTCRVHQGVRTSLDEPQCDIARPAEPFNDAYLDNIRQALAEGRNPSSRYITRRLLATLDATRAARTADPGGLDVERLARALDAPGVFDAPLDDALGLAHDIIREYLALTPEATAPEDSDG